MGKNKKCKDKVTWAADSESTFFDNIARLEKAKERKKNDKNDKDKDKDKFEGKKNFNKNKKDKRIRRDDDDLPSYLIINQRKQEAKERAMRAMANLNGSNDENPADNLTETSTSDKSVNHVMTAKTVENRMTNRPSPYNTRVQKNDKNLLLSPRVVFIPGMNRVIINDSISPHSIDMNDLEDYKITIDTTKLTSDEFHDYRYTLFRYIIASTHPTLVIGRDDFLKKFRKYQDINPNRFLILESDDSDYFAIWYIPTIVEDNIMDTIPNYYKMGIGQLLRFLAVLAVEGNKISNVFKMSSDAKSKEYVAAWVNYLDTRFSIDNITRQLLDMIDNDPETVIYDENTNTPTDVAKLLAFTNLEMKSDAHDLATSICYFQEMDLYEDDDDNTIPVFIPNSIGEYQLENGDDEEEEEDTEDDVEEYEDESDDDDDSEEEEEEEDTEGDESDNGEGEEEDESDSEEIVDITDDMELNIATSSSDDDDELPTDFPVRSKS